MSAYRDRPAPRAVSYETAIATAADRLNDALRSMHQTELAGGTRAVAEASSGIRNGMSTESLAEAYAALPREQPAARAA